MDHNTYVETIKQFIVYPPEREKEYLECLLFSEIGEVVGVHAKYVRGDFDEAEYKKRLIGELGDVLFAGSLLFNWGRFGAWVEEGYRYLPQSSIKAASYALQSFTSDRGEWSAYAVGKFIASMCNSLGITTEELREANVAKLKSRMERGKIKGDGDER